ncbi:hypothetical protein LQG66_09945 [Bradyrhizobium ontarionense]|uniref:Uncharacterized protein n=1 Tax=Bradyrhizobium ontarionense TaxID=2898149 RepID=A0ABY3RH28_9BRAD|nr:hypothetical protein [Bradyrhizobium sp. A19]UFZ06589.1 hypothetical protein LQG66_09945 [Bradyrhizobium sp. A19]
MDSPQSDDLSQIDKQLGEITDIASNRARTIAGGIVAFTWYAIAGSPDKSPNLVAPSSLYMPLVLSLLSLFADFLQYGFSWIDYFYRRSRITNHKPVVSLTFYRMSLLTFVAKICFVIASASWLMTILGRALQRLT